MEAMRTDRMRVSAGRMAFGASWRWSWEAVVVMVYDVSVTFQPLSIALDATSAQLSIDRVAPE